MQNKQRQQLLDNFKDFRDAIYAIPSKNLKYWDIFVIEPTLQKQLLGISAELK